MVIKFLNKKGQEFEIDCGEDEILLQAGLRNGVVLPYECSTGTCGSCKALAKPGTVNVNEKDLDGFKNVKISKGEFLLCQGTAKENCKILLNTDLSKSNNDDQLPFHQKAYLKDFKEVARETITANFYLSGKISFKAGQYIVVKHPSIEGYRAYSMTNFEENSDLLSLVIKNKIDGELTNYLFNSKDDEIKFDIFGPIGKATFNPLEKKNLLMIAGGTGIAGLMSILNHADQLSYFENYKIDLFFGVRKYEDFFFLDEITNLSKKYIGNFNVYFITSDEKVDSKISSCDVSNGFVHEVFENNLKSDYSERIAFLGGPSKMIDLLIPTLLKIGINPDSVRYDKFG